MVGRDPTVGGETFVEEGIGVTRSGHAGIAGKAAVFGVFYVIGLWTIICLLLAWSNGVFSLTASQLMLDGFISATIGTAQAVIVYREGRKGESRLSCLPYTALPQVAIACVALGVLGMAALILGVYGIVMLLDWLPDSSGRVLGGALSIVGLFLTLFFGLPLWPLFLPTILLLGKIAPEDKP